MATDFSPDNTPQGEQEVVSYETNYRSQDASAIAHEPFQSLMERASKGDVDAMRKAALALLDGSDVAPNPSEAVRLLESAARAGHLPALSNLASLLFQGIGCERNLTRSCVLYEEAAARGDSLAQLNLGLAYYQGWYGRRDYSRARDLLERAAAQDESEALSLLGGMYLNGQGVARNEERALEYYTEGILKGSSYAVVSLISLYEQSPDRNPATALEKLEAGAGQGNPFAAAMIGLLHMDGTLLGKRDYDVALDWLNKAIDADIAPVYAALVAGYGRGYFGARTQEDGLRLARYAVLGYQRNEPLCMGYYADLIARGVCSPVDDTPAQRIRAKAEAIRESAQYHGTFSWLTEFMLGRAGQADRSAAAPLQSPGAFQWTWNGQGNSKEEAMKALTEHLGMADDPRSQNLVKAVGGDIEAMVKHAAYVLFEDPRTSEGDLRTAFKYLEKARTAGNLDALMVLGRAYASGTGVQRDVVRSLALFQDAADKGHAEGWEALAEAYLTGALGEMNAPKAFECAKKGAEMGSLQAMTTLGYMYDHDVLKSGKRDVATACQWYKKAADAGHAEGLLDVGLMLKAGEAPAEWGSAEEYFKKAAELDHPKALTMLATELLDANRFDEAYGYFERAASKGDSEAQGQIAYALLAGGITTGDAGSDASQALAYARQGATRGDRRSLTALIYIFEKGIGFQPNPQVASAIKECMSKMKSGDGLYLEFRAEGIALGIIENSGLTNIM